MRSVEISVRIPYIGRLGLVRLVSGAIEKSQAGERIGRAEEQRVRRTASSSCGAAGVRKFRGQVY